MITSSSGVVRRIYSDVKETIEWLALEVKGYDAFLVSRIIMTMQT
ncbi:hypothetical protein [Pseudobutyrivibrio sp.]